MRHPIKRTTAFNVEAMRQKMLESVALPADLVNRALEVTRAKLTAKTTKFFTHQGMVVEKAIVNDHDVQLRAADQVYAIAAMYAREHDAPTQQPMVAVEVDATTGVVRLIIGGEPSVTSHDVVPTHASNTDDPPYEIQPIISEPEPEVEIIKVRERPGDLPKHIKEALFGDG